jgi:cytoskeleton protein RodZ
LPPLALIGEEIGEARKKRRMTTLEVSQKTRIPVRYVQCVENGDFAGLPGKTFVFGFTRTICALLGLDADAYIPIINSEMYSNCAGEPSIPVPSRRSRAVLRRFRSTRNPEPF